MDLRDVYMISNYNKKEAILHNSAEADRACQKLAAEKIQGLLRSANYSLENNMPTDTYTMDIQTSDIRKYYPQFSGHLHYNICKKYRSYLDNEMIKNDITNGKAVLDDSYLSCKVHIKVNTSVWEKILDMFI